MSVPFEQYEKVVRERNEARAERDETLANNATLLANNAKLRSMALRIIDERDEALADLKELRNAIDLTRADLRKELDEARAETVRLSYLADE